MFVLLLLLLLQIVHGLMIMIMMISGAFNFFKSISLKSIAEFDRSSPVIES
jgi:hypothetical protein